MKRLFIFVLLLSLVFTGCRNTLTDETVDDSNKKENVSGGNVDGNPDETTGGTTDDTTDETVDDTIVAEFIPEGFWSDVTLEENVGYNPESYNINSGEVTLLNITNNWQENDITVNLEDDNSGITVEVVNEADAAWKVQLGALLTEKLVTGDSYKLILSAKASEDSRFKLGINFADDDRVMDQDVTLSTEFQTFEYQFTARDATTDPDTSIERVQINMGNDTYEDGAVSIVTTGVTFSINTLQIAKVEE